MPKKRYVVTKCPEDPPDITLDPLWCDLVPLSIDEYMWMENGYTPEVLVRLFHTGGFIYLYYRVAEKRVTIRHTAFDSPVYTDSCVEFFLNPFPGRSEYYLNLEFNALGAMLVGFGTGTDSSKRRRLRQEETEGLEVVSSIKAPVVGCHGSDHWRLYIRLPKRILENQYGRPFTGPEALANFYKCGDETEWRHYGAWNRVASETPNFHLLESFGELEFAP